MKTIYQYFKNIMDYINNKLAEVCGFLLFVIMILLTVNTVSREIGNAIPGLTTLAVLVLIAVVYLGLSRAEQYDEHASVDMLPNMLSPKWRKINSIVVNILKLIFVSIFFYSSIGFFISSYQTQETFADVVKIPIWPAKLAILVGLFFFTLQILIKLVEDIKSLVTEKT